MKALLYGGLGLFVFGLIGNIPVFIGLGIVGVGAFTTIKLTGWGARTTKSAVSNALAERREEKDFQKNLRRKVEEERALAGVRNEATIELLRAQVSLIAAHKREGLNVFACDKLSGSKCANDSNTTYYTFLHLDAVSGLKTGQSLKNVTIGTIADLSKKGAVSHLHFTKRYGVWHDTYSLRGSLPPAECNDSATRQYLPSFPEKFVTPDTGVYEITKK